MSGTPSKVLVHPNREARAVDAVLRLLECWGDVDITIAPRERKKMFAQQVVQRVVRATPQQERSEE